LNVSYKYYWEDFYPGQVLETGGYSLSEEEIIEFARKYDPQPFHIDSEKAKQTFFGELIASGWQTASICMRMICDLYLIEAASLGSPGVDELRWVKPVRPGDTLRLKSTVLETRASSSRPDMGTVRSRSEVYNQHGELVMHMSGVSMFRRRNPGE
jgi:acyl dehydratase